MSIRTIHSGTAGSPAAQRGRRGALETQITRRVFTRVVRPGVGLLVRANLLSSHRPPNQCAHRGDDFESHWQVQGRSARGRPFRAQVHGRDHEPPGGPCLVLRARGNRTCLPPGPGRHRPGRRCVSQGQAAISDDRTTGASHSSAGSDRRSRSAWSGTGVSASIGASHRWGGSVLPAAAQGSQASDRVTRPPL